MDGPEERRCIVCGRMSLEGVVFLGHRLCPGCMDMIQQLQPGDPAYEHVKDTISQLWASTGAMERYPRP